MAERLTTTAGEFDLEECSLRVGGREWSILHTAALMSWVEEQIFLGTNHDRIPYGAALWPSAIALAHELASRGNALRGKTVLELGAGTGLPGIVASTFGARVTQTDNHDVAMHLCRRNGARNGARGIEYRNADWSSWDDVRRYDLIIGADILYSDTMHDRLHRLFNGNLAAGGRILVSDPFRKFSLGLLETLESQHWRVGMTKWIVGEGEDAQPIGVFELVPPA
jgi:methyltransferase-like protein 23